MKSFFEKIKHVSLVVALPVAVIVGVISLSSFSSFKTKTVTIWSQLGISESTGLENIRNSFLEGYLYTYGASAAKKIALGERTAVANEVLVYSKQYVKSPAFKQVYDEARAASKPVAPAPPKTKEQIQKERIDELTRTLAEQEKSMKTLPADLIPAFMEVQKMLQDQMKDYENIDSPMLGLMFDGEQYNYKNGMQQYEENIKTWEKEYPADHLKMVKSRLEKFLELTKDVDFHATLKEEYRLKKFVNPAYEKKSAEWKMAFRAGEPVLQATRAFAKEWLSELN